MKYLGDGGNKNLGDEMEKCHFSRTDPFMLIMNFRARVGAQWGVIPQSIEHVWSWNLLGDDTGNQE